MTVNIRRATENDISQIAEVGKRSFTWAFGHLFPEDILRRYLQETYSDRKVSTSFAKSKNVYFVAAFDMLIHGFLKLKRDCPHPSVHSTVQWQLQKLYIDPDAIRSGLGQKLMMAGESMMVDEAVDCSWLVVYKNNQGAIQFYTTFGFKDAGIEFHDFEHIRIEFKLLKKEYKKSNHDKGGR